MRWERGSKAEREGTEREGLRRFRKRGSGMGKREGAGERRVEDNERMRMVEEVKGKEH